MSQLIQGAILFCATIIVIVATLRTLLMARAIRHQKEIESDIIGCGSLGFAGCSIICSKVRDIEQIEALLSSEHDHYEVIITLDGFTAAEAFDAIVRHFRLIRVNTPTSNVLHTTPIRALYRSRYRCFRRLVLIDKQHGSPQDDFNTAATIAAFDYLLPIRSKARLRKYAIESINIALTSLSGTTTNLLRSAADDTCIFRREYIIEVGGFRRNILKKIPFKTRRTTFLPLQHIDTARLRAGIFCGAVIIGLLLLAAILTSHAAMKVALIASVVAMVCIARYLVLIIDDKDSVKHTIYNIGHSASLFYRINFFF